MEAWIFLCSSFSFTNTTCIETLHNMTNISWLLLFICYFNFSKGSARASHTHTAMHFRSFLYTKIRSLCTVVWYEVYRFYILLFKVDFYSDHFLVFTLEEINMFVAKCFGEKNRDMCHAFAL